MLQLYCICLFFFLQKLLPEEAYTVVFWKMLQLKDIDSYFILGIFQQ